MFELRDYQRRSLDALTRFLKQAGKQDARTAFILETNRPYHAVPGLEDLPYICLRIPTGGGKTFMAAHAVGIAARELLQVERAVCLWLVPSNAILEQTLAALRNRQNPYRQALDTAFAGQVEVMTLQEALYVTRATLDGAAVIIVATLAALRVEDTEGRKIYESAGALQPHFDTIPDMMRARMETAGDGVIQYSLANVLRMRRPIVIMDEAHNARTALSFETLVRVTPSCVIEFTATPETKHNSQKGLYASNILHHVSARELKAEEMLKLPVRLVTHANWKEIIGLALDKQRELEAAALAEGQRTGEYLRPIVLLQAQPQNQKRPTLTVEVVKDCLMTDFRIPAEQIAIATGQTRELDNVDLNKPTCPIRYIITVQALREGWDCPFAYVLCSVAEQHSARSVEQILGRVLRMPKAKRKHHPHLNCAYAFVASTSFQQTASTLTDSLVENGFQEMEARDLIVEDESRPLSSMDLRFEGTAQVTESPDLSHLDDELARRVSFDESTRTLTVTGPINPAQVQELKACFQDNANRQAVERMTRQPAGVPRPRFVIPAEPLVVPLLSVRVNGRLEIFEDSHFLDAAWDLRNFSPELSEEEFSPRLPQSTGGEIDIGEKGRMEIVSYTQQVQQELTLFAIEPNWTVPALATWLDRQIPHPDIPLEQSSLFIHRSLTHLIESRGIRLEQLARLKFRLRNALEEKIDKHRQAQRRQGYQAALFGPTAMQAEVDPMNFVTLDEDRYAPNWYYEGAYRFQKPAFKEIGELKSEGEEFDCAVIIDSMPEVKRWVRNLARSDSSFWLQTSTDRFYPDFVALLNDGRILVVEYKSGRDWTNDDSKEKRAVGELWEARSSGRCLFVMPKDREWGMIRAKVGGLD